MCSRIGARGWITSKPVHTDIVARGFLWRGGLPPLDREAVPKPIASVLLEDRI